MLVEHQGLDGPEPLSVVLDLRRNSRNELDVRIAEGMRLWDGRHLWEIAPTTGAEGHGLRVNDLHASLGGDIPLHADAPLQVARMTRRDVWVRLPNGSIAQCELDRPRCAPGALEPLPLDHPGPGVGFQLSLENGELRLQVPFAPAPGIEILDHVTSVLGVHWVHEAWLDRDPLLDRTYRGRGTITAVPLLVTLDGDLHEWKAAEPLIVEAPWQVESGADRWSGNRDAGFSVAAARTSRVNGPVACFAGRIRDDDWTPDDALTFYVGGVQLAVALLTPSTVDSRVGDGWFSRAYEVCLPISTELPELPFSVVFRDHDEEGDTVLASAPTVGGHPTGILRISR